MARGRNKLTGYDASEGALYVLFAAVLALHPRTPNFLAVDNVDQSLNPLLAKKVVGAVCNWTLQRRLEITWCFIGEHADALAI